MTSATGLDRLAITIVRVARITGVLLVVVWLVAMVWDAFDGNVTGVVIFFVCFIAILAALFVVLWAYDRVQERELL